MTSIYGIIAAVKRFQTLLWIVVVGFAFAEGQPFSRYETIINRKPFGPEPENFDPDAAPGSESATSAGEGGEMTPEQRSAEEQQLASSVRVSILNVTPAGVVKVGFTDSTAKPPENYYLKVGASQNGWTVKAADPATESVTLEKGGVEVTVKLGEASGNGGKGGGKGGAKVAAKSAAPQRRMPQMLGGGGGGLARLRMQRMEQEKMRLEAEEKQRKAEAAAKAEQEEREAKAAEEKQALAEERAQQREALLQIQEQLRKQREEREARRAQQGQDNDEDNDT